MHILCVIDSLGSGGAQRQLVGLALGFVQRGHQVSFLVYHNKPFFRKTLEQAGIQVNMVIEPNYLKRLLRMRSFIRKGKFDAVIGFLEASAFICEMAGWPYRRWKLLVGERSANPAMFRSPKRLIYRWFHLLADYVVANSRANIQMIRRINPLLNNKRCRVILNLTDLNYWKPIPEAYQFRHNGYFHLLVIASHSYQKNLRGLIEAVRMLDKSRRDQIRIHWYGAPSNDNSYPEAIELIKQYQLDKFFEFYPPAEEIPLLINQADAIGLFSFYEGLPNVICEAMACGKPVIVPAVADLPEIVEDGVNGFVCHPRKPESIARAINQLLDLTMEKLLEMGMLNRNKALALFHPDQIIKEYLQLISFPTEKI